MSRSYKKFPVFTDDSWKRFGKRFAAKTVRRRNKLACREYMEYEPSVAEQDELKSSDVKKVYESYDICDYKFIPSTKEQVVESIRK